MLYTSLCSGRGHGWGTLEERARLSILISLRMTISRPRRISLSWNSETPSSSSKSKWWQSWINHSDGGSAEPHSPLKELGVTHWPARVSNPFAEREFVACADGVFGYELQALQKQFHHKAAEF